MPKGAKSIQPGCGTSATPCPSKTGETHLLFSCHLCPFNAYSNTILLHHIKEHSVFHPEVASGDLQKGLDAGLHRSSHTQSGSTSTRDVGVMGRSIHNERSSDFGLNTAECSLNIDKAPSTSSQECFSCHLCPYTFSDKYHLTRHIRTHTKEKPFICNICSCSFREKYGLTRHAAIHTNENRYKCEKCPAEQFSSRADLAQHMYSHTEKKLFKCRICSRISYDRSSLARHMRTHTGDKPYKCEHCPLSFSLACNLRRHILQHTGEKPFVCSVCSRAFASKRSLLHHADTHKK